MSCLSSKVSFYILFSAITLHGHFTATDWCVLPHGLCVRSLSFKFDFVSDPSVAAAIALQFATRANCTCPSRLRFHLMHWTRTASAKRPYVNAIFLRHQRLCYTLGAGLNGRRTLCGFHTYVGAVDMWVSRRGVRSEPALYAGLKERSQVK